MTSFAKERVRKFLVFLGVVSLHVIILVFLSHVVLFHEPASAFEFKAPNFQMVKIAPPPLPVPPPPPELPAPPMTAQAGGGSKTLLFPAVIMLPPRATFSLPKMPSTDEVLARLPQPNFGRESGTGNGDGVGSGKGNGNGGGQGVTDTSQDQHTVTAHPKKTGSTLIFAYIGNGNIEGAKQWLDDGNDPNVPYPYDDYINWPVDWAIIANQPEILKMLLEHGAKPDPPNRRDQQWFRTVYLAAITYSSPEMLKLVLDSGAKPDPIPSQDNRNSVHLVVDDSPNQGGGNFTEKKQVEILKMLLDHGANPLSKDSFGVSALSSAQRQHRQDMVSIIEESLKQSYAQNQP